MDQLWACDRCVLIGQLRVEVDMDSREVTVIQMGKCASRVGTRLLQQGERCVIGPGASLELLADCYKYTIFFGKRVLSESLNTLRLQSNDNSASSVSGELKRKRSPSPDSDSVRTPACAVLNSEKGNIGSEDPRYVSMADLVGFVYGPLVNLPSPRQSSLSRFFSLTSKQYPTSWRYSDSLLVFSYGKQTPSAAIAAFDIDGTITTTKSGRLPFRAPPDDWKFLGPEIPGKLSSVLADGYRLVFFTNQGGIFSGNPTMEEFQVKMQAMAEVLKSLPLLVITSLGEDFGRKPLPGMWEYFVECENDSVGVDVQRSFFVGDAAGRPEGWAVGELVTHTGRLVPLSRD